MGAKYVARGELVDPATGKPLVDEATGKTIAAVAEFTPVAAATGDVYANGTVDVEFTVPDSLRGTTAVVFERVWLADTVTVTGTEVTPTSPEGSQTPSTPVAVHEDVRDTDQTVTFPVLGTLAANTAGSKTVDANGTLVDTVKFTGLVAGTTYTIERHG